MPLIEKSHFQPHVFLRLNHLQSLYSTSIRRVLGVCYSRERIDTPDGDFLDLDWSKVGSKKLVILSHGLEGSSQSSYMLGMLKILNNAGIDVLSWNYRGCSGEVNKTIKMYHSGAIYDLETVCQHIEKLNLYQEVSLVGFSLGANLTLLYLAKNPSTLKDKLVSSVVFSAPCELSSSTQAMREGIAKLYQKHFISLLKEKVRNKSKLFPKELKIEDLNRIRTFEDYDNRFIAPIHGFNDAWDYWQKCSSLYHLDKIRIPTLIVNALDDPVLGKECYPFEIAKEHNCLFLETPKMGGHCGFFDFLRANNNWAERRALEFISNCSPL